ncbi:sugar phosphate isomerase/epimerase [Cellulophaga sp. F20128]|uniref:sugar phosphate isomerase/epimerase family protein n=1 Tax=Cellulophaga sp. F20128 TaxID=2926413 RepID=UPI001FF42894|nr:sugar phosphate isomerase/epimerase [Cellulophaga sp. F20128]MCK0157932.1 sugar phosphate isomerase/epimerase [Cellulophaga sp. F20128]
MRLYTLVFIIFIAVITPAKSQNKVQFFQTNWGSSLGWDQFCQKAKASGYDGIEVWMPNGADSQNELKNALEKHKLAIIFLHGTSKGTTFNESLKNYSQKLEAILEWKPVAVNCHTGSDFFTTAQNKAFIDAANKISKKHGIPVYHETHRGRFSYSLPETQKYLSLIPDLKLTLDISHWMVVHESLLQGKEKELQEVIHRSEHIHARVGHAESPQVNDPEAPEWKGALDRHLDIWEEIILKKWKEGHAVYTITTEFGPPNYMPTLPYTKVPVADQWKANVFIMNAIKERLKIQ